MSPFLVLPRALTKPLRWPAESVRRARHNAYAANAALAVRRAEREEVDQFLSEHHRHRLGRGGALPPEAGMHLPQPRTER